ncbi:unnamed protein product, partial [Mesorhabditis belari]|uniref:Uncharacterized protein n=1 Tax=Mesorhabditis belari TaxID=2138241 RepID=A0AAF3F8D5_9BILA
MQTDELEHHTFNNTLVDESVLDDDEMDNLTILGEKPELTLSKRDTTENGDHQVSDFRTIDDQAAISRLIDELVQKVSSDAPITTSTADTNKEFDMDIKKVTTFSDSIQHNLYESHSQEQNQDCFNGIKEADGHNKMLGLTRPELKRYVHARLNACCTNK